MSHHVCQCECGGEVVGVEDHGLLWTWCESCSPVEAVEGGRLTMNWHVPAKSEVGTFNGPLSDESERLNEDADDVSEARRALGEGDMEPYDDVARRLGLT